MTICVIISLDIDEPISFAPPGAQSTCIFTQVLLTFMLQHIRNFDSNAVINNKKTNPITSDEVIGLLFNLVELTGLEPVTPSMSTRYSNQLSYSSATMLF